jgi:hypothetical protein
MTLLPLYQATLLVGDGLCISIGNQRRKQAPTTAKREKRLNNLVAVFRRHDNLLQHLTVAKNTVNVADGKLS